MPGPDKRRTRCGGCAGTYVGIWTLFGACLAPAAAPAAGQPDIEARLEQLQTRQKQLQKENAAFRRRLETPETSVSRAADALPDKTADTLFGYHDGGGGFSVETPDNSFRLLGYAQAVGSLVDSRLDRPENNGDFAIRCALIDFLADLHEDFQFLVEFDGGPGTTQTEPSDFALVEARFNWRILDDGLQLRAGKFTTPFSAENFTTSRAIDTVERYLALNSLFLLPALDVQFGTLVHGRLGASDQWMYFLGAFNGNGRTNDNFSDNNSHKEIQAKLQYRWTRTLSTGLAMDISSEEPQTLSLADLGFNRYVSVPVAGSREGFEVDLAWRPHPFHLTAGFLGFRFDPDRRTTTHPTRGRHAQTKPVGFYGGFVQPSYFMRGSHDRGIELLWRSEFAHLDADTGGDGDTLYATTLG